jgi:hypothetical protein
MQRVLVAKEEYKKTMSLFDSNTFTTHSLLNPLHAGASVSPSSAKVTQPSLEFEEAMNSKKQADPVKSTRQERDLNSTPIAASTSKSGCSAPKAASTSKSDCSSASHFKPSMPRISNANLRKSSHIPSSTSALLKTELLTNAKISTHDDEHAKEYPDGDAVWRIEKVHIYSRQDTTPIFGWALATNGQKKHGDGLKCIYKYCLGVYKCAHCEFVERPRQQQCEKHKCAPPLPPKGKCPSCEGQEDLILVECRCEIILTEHDNHWILQHKGSHKHPCPPPVKAPALQQKAFETMVKNNPGAGARQLRLGAHTRMSVMDIHASFSNQDRVSTAQKK